MERPRFSISKGGKIRTYVPSDTIGYEAEVGFAAIAAGVRKPVTGPVAGAIRFGISGAGDVDNLTKTVLDGLRSHAYNDDRQVEFLILQRLAAARDKQFAEILLWDLMVEHQLIDQIVALLPWQHK
jgi:Holliday junction resolvase RusA-like endonuclease